MNEINFTTFNSFMHYGVKGMKWGVINEDKSTGRSRRRGSIDISNVVKAIKKRGSGLGTGPVGTTSSQRPVASKPIAKRGEGLGTGPVGTTSSKRPIQQNNQYGSHGQYNVAMEGRQKNNTGEVGKPIAKRGEGLGSDTPSQDIVNMQNKPNQENQNETPEPIVDEEYEQRKQEYKQITSDLDRYEKAFESISDMDPKYQKKLFDKYKTQMLNLVSRHQEVLGYKPYPQIENAKDMVLFFKYYNKVKEEGNYE